MCKHVLFQKSLQWESSLTKSSWRRPVKGKLWHGWRRHPVNQLMKHVQLKCIRPTQNATKKRKHIPKHGLAVGIAACSLMFRTLATRGSRAPRCTSAYKGCKTSNARLFNIRNSKSGDEKYRGCKHRIGETKNHRTVTSDTTTQNFSWIAK